MSHTLGPEAMRVNRDRPLLAGNPRRPGRVVSSSRWAWPGRRRGARSGLTASLRHGAHDLKGPTASVRAEMETTVTGVGTLESAKSTIIRCELERLGPEGSRAPTGRPRSSIWSPRRRPSDAATSCAVWIRHRMSNWCCSRGSPSSGPGRTGRRPSATWRPPCWPCGSFGKASCPSPNSNSRGRSPRPSRTCNVATSGWHGRGGCWTRAMSPPAGLPSRSRPGCGRR